LLINRLLPHSEAAEAKRKMIEQKSMLDNLQSFFFVLLFVFVPTKLGTNV